MKFKFIQAALAAVVFTVSGIANAGLINGALNVDNQHWVYLSTDDNIQGDLISSGNNWRTTDFFQSSLNAGTDYFLHIYAKDVGGIAGFLGEFSLTGGDHVFSNGLTEILTNTTDWNVSTSGWNNYGATYSAEGNNGVWPWNKRAAIDDNASWIWSVNHDADNEVYFSLAITAVPEPSTFAIFALGLMGLVARRIKK